MKVMLFIPLLALMGACCTCEEKKPAEVSPSPSPAQVVEPAKPVEAVHDKKDDGKDHKPVEKIEKKKESPKPKK